MKIYVGKRGRIIIVLVILFASLIIAFSRSNIIDVIKSPSKIIYGCQPEEAENLFEKLTFSSKFTLEYVTQNLKDALKFVDKNEFNINENNLYYKTTDDNISILLKTSKEDLSKLKSKFKTLSDLNLKSERMIRNVEEFFIEDLKIKINDEENYKKTINAKIRSSRNPTDLGEYHEKLCEQNEILSLLKCELDNREKRKDYILTKINISKVFIKTSSLTKAIETFMKTFILGVVVTSALLILCNFIIAGLLKLFSLIGIRSSRLSSRYGGKYGGYGGKYGGYGSYGGYGKKIVKRKYKDKSESESDDSESDEKSKSEE
ncbi:MAG: hypothetical protein H8E33_02010 [Candidatus Cloacimonetes bacterium]|nr:hypothetical protein [Candidatus Cloacimonadota bacterium]MBL7108586.1 hypothetical protein [Candidatus Cloacimonadota bacterium]